MTFQPCCHLSCHGRVAYLFYQDTLEKTVPSPINYSTQYISNTDTCTGLCYGYCKVYQLKVIAAALISILKYEVDIQIKSSPVV